MTPDMLLKKQVESFIAAIAPLEDAYQNDNFAYVAVRTPAGFVIVRGYLHLSINEGPPLLPHFQSATIRAGHFRLTDVKLNRRQFIDCTCGGVIPTPDGELLFPTHNGHPGAQFIPFHPEGLKTQSRLCMLRLLGSETRQHTDSEALNWELRAADPPYDGLVDLLTEYRLFQLADVSTIEVVAYSVCAIDARSTIDGEGARMAIQLASSLSRENVSAGYRIIDQGKTVARGRFVGTDFTWADEGVHQLGTRDFNVPRAAVVHAMTNYNAIAQHHFFFGDPKTFQNPRRAALEVLDITESFLTDIVEKASGRANRPEKNNFEAIIPWIFWTHGFCVTHIGGVPQLQELPDIIMTTPAGHFVVVECTVGMLKGDQKLQKLHDRALAVRRGLDASKQQHLRVLPMIVTAKTVEEIRPDITEAEKLGVFVVARAQIDQLIEQTIIISNPDLMFERAEATVKAALEKHPLAFLPVPDAPNG
jgi:hypothetical protein